MPTRLGWTSGVLLLAALVSVAAKPPKLDEALAAQRGLAAQRPSDVKVLNDLANLLVLAGELEEAEATYREALRVAPDETVVRYNLALALQQRGADRQARHELQRVVRADPRHAWAHYQLGTLHAEQAHRERAIRAYARAFLIDPSLVEPEVNAHIVDNKLTTEAMLKAYGQRSPATGAPRLYQEPGRIAELLVPPLPAAKEEAVADARRRQRGRASLPGAEDEELPGAAESAGRALAEGAAEEDEGTSEDFEDEDALAESTDDEATGESARPRVLTERDLAPRGQVVVTPGVVGAPTGRATVTPPRGVGTGQDPGGGPGSGTGGGSAPGGGGQDPGGSPGGGQDPGDAPPPPAPPPPGDDDGEDPFDPDLPSTGLLELRLLPASEAKVAALSAGR